MENIDFPRARYSSIQPRLSIPNLGASMDIVNTYWDPDKQSIMNFIESRRKRSSIMVPPVNPLEKSEERIN